MVIGSQIMLISFLFLKTLVAYPYILKYFQKCNIFFLKPGTLCLWFCIKSIQTCFAFSKNTSLIVSSAFGYAYVSSLRIVRFGISFAVFLDFFQVGCIKILLSSNLCVWRLSVWGFGVWVFRCLRLCSLTRGSWAPEFPVLSSQFPLTRSQFPVFSSQLSVCLAASTATYRHRTGCIGELKK